MHCLQFKITHVIFQAQKITWTVMFLIDDAINYTINRGVPHGHPRLGYQRFHVELCENAYLQKMEGSKVVIELWQRSHTCCSSFVLSVPAFIIPVTIKPRQKCFDSGITFLMDIPSLLEYAIFVYIKTYCGIAGIYCEKKYLQI